MLMAAIMVKSLTESQKVTKFHALRSLNMGIPGCITNFNPWPPGSLRPRSLQSGDDSAEPLVQRQLCQQWSILAAVLSNIPPREISDACKNYRITGV